MNLLGKTVHTGLENQQQVDLNLSGLAKGMYFVELNINGQTLVERVILE